MLVRLSVNDLESCGDWRGKEWVVYCGRSNWSRGLVGSVLGNRFSVKEFGRSECIRRYRRWLWNELNEGNEEVWGELRRIMKLEERCGRVCLVCWCGRGNSCHCEVIIKCLRYLYGEVVVDDRPLGYPAHDPPGFAPK